MAVFNGVMSLFWAGIAAMGDSGWIIFICSLNASILGAAAGGRLADHFHQKVRRIQDKIIDEQNRLIVDLLRERQIHEQEEVG